MNAWLGKNWVRRFVCALLLLIAGWQARHWYDHQTGLNKLHHPLETALWWVLLAVGVAVFVYHTKNHGAWSFALGAVIGIGLVGWWYHLHDALHVNGNDFAETFAGVLIVVVLVIGAVVVGKKHIRWQVHPAFTKARKRVAGTRIRLAKSHS